MAINFLAHSISGLSEPTFNSGAANKAYVDSKAGDVSSQITLSSGLTSDDNIWHDGNETDMFLNDVPQTVIKSGSSWQYTREWMIASGTYYSQSYASAQIALYTDTDVNHDLTTGFVEAEHVNHVGGYMSGSLSGSTLLMGGITIDTILDEDDMSTDSATALATQQSIKKYVDDNGGGSPGGSDAHIQYNNGGAFGGATNFSYIDGDSSLVFSGNLYISGQISSNASLTIYADDVYGKVHYSDILFKETWCDICGDTFKKGDISVLIVKSIGNETAMVPVHLRCAMNKEEVI